MIQHAFTGAYTNKVSQQNQAINTISQGVKDAATLALGVTGFAGGLGQGVVSLGAEHALAGRIGGVGGNIMLATLKEKKDSAKANKERKEMFSEKEISTEIKSQLGSNPINRTAIKNLDTVFETLKKKKIMKEIEEGLDNDNDR
jgi:hypothetical protein